MSQLEYERKLEGTESLIRLKNCWRPEIQGYQFARLYFGFNCIWEELTVPKGLISIPIPFMRHNHGFIRYKKFIKQRDRIPQLDRLDSEIARLEFLVNQKDSQQQSIIGKDIIRGFLHELHFIKYGRRKDA